MLNLHNFAVPTFYLGNAQANTNAFGIAFFREKLGTGETYRTSCMGASISAHYFFLGHFSFGLNVSGSTFNNEGSEAESIRLFLVGPELRCYLPLESRVYFWVNTQAGRGKVILIEDFGSFSFSSRRLSMGGGMAYFLREYLSFNAGFGYSWYKFLSEEDPINSSISSRGLTLDLGVSLFFR
ncbi:MAG: hypothetical protein NZM43_10425 [Saprospiraceae bacterium]|nr:hypothetical protein [Saprospiraceae bacterium]MDW8484725.1 hypothetical protein [Saprospiraceae bacterium]